MMDAKRFIRWYIETWEGGLSLNPKDHGNYWGGKLVGSKYGVTPATYSAWSGKEISADVMKNITEDEAIQIGIDLFYHRSRIDLLPWNAVTASIMDKVWGSGWAAIRLLQKMLRLPQDGVIGKNTIANYVQFIASNGEEKAATIWAKCREDYDHSLRQLTFERGWNNRTEGFLPNTKFWSLFHE